MVQAKDTDNLAEMRSMQTEASMIVSSNGSINHPYRTLFKGTSFPLCHFMARPGSEAETFNSSLGILGHGSPLWDVIEVLGGYKFSRISIGDVGFLNNGGDFEPFFNIFLPPEHPRQHYCPPNLIPLDAPLQSDIAINPMQFPPGTALVSTGIEASTLSSSSLDIKFTVNAHEGGILIFPDGALREDLLSTARIRDYVQQHLLEWYQFVKKKTGDIVVHTNGTLYVVTGTDKATTWANCVTYTEQTQFYRLWEAPTITYHGTRDNDPHHWSCARKIDKALTYQRSRPIAEVDKYALFIRGMRFALNIHNWTEHLLCYQTPEVVQFSVIRTVSIYGLRAKIQTLKECRRGYKEKCPVEAGLGFRVIFHPLDVILRLLLEESPSAKIAYIEDYIWFSVVDKRDASLAEIVHLLVKILEPHETLKEDGRITLVPHAKQPHTISSNAQHTAENDSYYDYEPEEMQGTYNTSLATQNVMNRKMIFFDVM